MLNLDPRQKRATNHSIFQAFCNKERKLIGLMFDYLINLVDCFQTYHLPLIENLIRYLPQSQNQFEKWSEKFVFDDPDIFSNIEKIRQSPYYANLVPYGLHKTELPSSREIDLLRKLYSDDSSEINSKFVKYREALHFCMSTAVQDLQKLLCLVKNSFGKEESPSSWIFAFDDLDFSPANKSPTQSPRKKKKKRSSATLSPQMTLDRTRLKQTFSKAPATNREPLSGQTKITLSLELRKNGLDLESKIEHVLLMRSKGCSLADHCHSAIHEVKSHIFLGNMGLEIFLRTLSQKKFNYLETIVPMLLLDWHVQLEQTLSLLYMVEKGELASDHSLVALVEKLGLKDRLPATTVEHLKELKRGLIWARYPIHVRDQYREPPRPLKWILFTQELCKEPNSTVDDQTIKSLKKLLNYVVERHLKTQAALQQLMGIEASIEEPSLLKEEKERLEASLTPLKGQSIARLSSNKKKPKIFFVDRFTTYLNESKLEKMLYGNPLVFIREALALVSQLSQVPPLMKENSSPHLLPWHYRNVLHFQRLLEQLYIADGILTDTAPLITHRFEIFHQLLDVKNPKDKIFDNGRGMHYPHAPEIMNNPAIRQLRTLIKKCREIDSEGFKSISASTIDLDYKEQEALILSLFNTGKELAAEHLAKTLANLKNAGKGSIKPDAP